MMVSGYVKYESQKSSKERGHRALCGASVVVRGGAGSQTAPSVCGNADRGWEQQSGDLRLPLGSGGGGSGGSGAGGGERKSDVSGTRSRGEVSVCGERDQHL